MKKTILWLPGLHTTQEGPSAQAMRALVEELGAEFHFLRWPNHEDGAAQEGFTFTAALDVVKSEIEHLQALGHKVVLAGTSFGGWVAAWVAQEVAVDGLVLCNPSLNFVFNYLTTQLPVGQAEAGWKHFAFGETFRYTIPQEDGTKKALTIPQTFLRDTGLDGFNVLASQRQLLCTQLLVVTPPAEEEGFLASPVLAHQFAQQSRAQGVHTTTIADDRTFGHGVRTVVSDDVRNALSVMLNAI